MTDSTDSSDESAGGAPLYSPTSSSTGENSSANGPTGNTRPDPTSDDEMALVRASSKFIHRGKDGVNPFLASSLTSPQQGRHAARPSTAMTPQGPNYGGRGGQGGGHGAGGYGGYNDNFTSPPHCGNHGRGWSNAGAHGNGGPYSKDVSGLQGRLVTVQQYVRISPGITSELASNIQSQLMSIGQELNAFFALLGNDHKKSQYQNGELRVQLDLARNELAARKKQVEELQSKYTTLVKERDTHRDKNAELVGRLGDTQAELMALRDYVRRLAAQDERNVVQLQLLEAEMEGHGDSKSNSMQLVKASPSLSGAIDAPQDSSSTSSSANETASGRSKKGKSSARRLSCLNPEAPTFGPEIAAAKSTAETADGGFVLSKYTSSSTATAKPFSHQRAFVDDLADRPLTPLAKQPNLGRTSYSTQDARAYSGGREPSGRDRRLSSAPMGRQSSQAPGPFGNSSGELSAGGERFRIAKDKVEWDTQDIYAGFSRLYELMEGLVATQHCDGPFHDPDSSLFMTHPDTWAYVLSMGLSNKAQSASHMMHLLGDSDCRHFVIKRIMVDYVFNRLISPDVFYGFSAEMDGHLRALQEKMRTRAPGTAVRAQGVQRQRLIQDHAKLIKYIIYAPEGKAFRENLVYKYTEVLVEVLRPMRSCTVDDDTARKGLHIVINAAWTITSKLWTSGMTIHYYFPETGIKFSQASMRHMNHLDIPQEQVQFAQWRVMLIITPALSLRDDREVDAVRTHELMRSDVLVMK